MPAEWRGTIERNKMKTKIISQEKYSTKRPGIMKPGHPLYPHPKDAVVKRVEVLEKGTAEVDGELQSYYTVRIYFARLP